MHERKWIAESGMCDKSGLEVLVTKKVGNEEACFLAMMTNEFYSDIFSVDNIKSVDWNYLLELRVFNEKYEFLAVRGSIGESFSWRITTDEKL